MIDFTSWDKDNVQTPIFISYSKKIGDYYMCIVLGNEHDYMKSDPIDISLSFSQYKTVSIELCESKSTLVKLKNAPDLGIDYSTLSINPYNTHFMSIMNVPISLVEIIYDNLIRLSENKSPIKIVGFDNSSTKPISSSKIGGVCYVCNSPDDWASWHNNKAYCYKHTPGF